MTARFPIAPLQLPPSGYDRQYFNEVIRSLNLYFRLLQTPGPVYASGFYYLDGVELGGGAGGAVPYYVPTNTTVTLSENYQYFFRLPIEVDGTFEVGGYLMEI